MNPQNEFQKTITELSVKYAKQLRIILLLSLILFVIGLLLKILDENNSVLLFVGAGLSSLLSFLRSFKPIDLNRDSQSNSILESYGTLAFASKLNHLAISIATIGIFFSMERIPGGDIMIFIGSINILISLFHQLFLMFKSKGQLINKELLAMNIFYLFLISMVLFILF